MKTLNDTVVTCIKVNQNWYIGLVNFYTECLRVSHMNYCTNFEIITTIMKISKLLNDLCNLFDKMNRLDLKSLDSKLEYMRYYSSE